MSGKVVAPRKTPKTAGSTLLILGDFVVTALWVFGSSTFSQIAEWLHEISSVDEYTLVLGLTISALIFFGPLCNLFGGAIFNPIHNVALLSSGKGIHRHEWTRMVSQLLGAVFGSYAARHLLPFWLQSHFHKLPGGVKNGILIQAGFACEALLSLFINLVFLYSLASRNKIMAYWTPLVATVFLNVVGSHFTGPSLNPVVTFSWFWHFGDSEDMLEHVLVFWAAPLLGAVVSGLLVRWVEIAVAKQKPIRRKKRL